MILLDVVIVAVSNAPLGLFFTYIVSSGRRGLTPTEELVYVVVRLLSTTQVFSSYYLYLIISSTFRKNVKKILRKILFFWKIRVTNQVVPSVGTVIEFQNKMPNVII